MAAPNPPHPGLLPPRVHFSYFSQKRRKRKLLPASDRTAVIPTIPAAEDAAPYILCGGHAPQFSSQQCFGLLEFTVSGKARTHLFGCICKTGRVCLTHIPLLTIMRPLSVSLCVLVLATY